MPIIQQSTYCPPFPFRWTHFNTIYTSLFRSVPTLLYEREKIKTRDGDFLELDWLRGGHDRLIICLHGLEGSSDKAYIKGMLHKFQSAEWDGLALNFRSCAGQPNEKLRSYNMGATADLHFLIKHIEKKAYKSIALVGFSLGAHLMLKYIGEGGNFLPKKIKAAVAISTPCYIPEANIRINHWANRAYLNRFMKTLNAKMKHKKMQYPEYITLPDKAPKNFQEFDAIFTGPIHGYSSAMDYWESCSISYFLPNIKRPVLIINALDDTFLSEECYPYEQARENDYLYLETPAHGGHCGFYSKGEDNDNAYWSENRALAFIESVLK